VLLSDPTISSFNCNFAAATIDLASETPFFTPFESPPTARREVQNRTRRTGSDSEDGEKLPPHRQTTKSIGRSAETSYLNNNGPQTRHLSFKLAKAVHNSRQRVNQPSQPESHINCVMQKAR